MAAKILIVENDPLYADVTINILRKADLDYLLCKNLDQIKDSLNNDRFDLALVDISLIRGADIDLIDFIRVQNKTPVILTTEENIDQHFDLITEKHITQVLNKPIKSSELINVITKLLNPDSKLWFGLENYLMNIVNLKKIELKRSNQLRPTINAVLQYIERWGFEFEMQFEMDLVWQEILTNAIYHSHSYSQQKKDAIAIELPDPYKVVVRFGASKTQFAISVRDFRGTLSPKIVLDSLNSAIEQQNLLKHSIETGEDISDDILNRGRGLDFIRGMTGEYYFIIDARKSTEIIMIYDGAFEKDYTHSSIKIFELPINARRD